MILDVDNQSLLRSQPPNHLNPKLRGLDADSSELLRSSKKQEDRLSGWRLRSHASNGRPLCFADCCCTLSLDICREAGLPKGRNKVRLAQSCSNFCTVIFDKGDDFAGDGEGRSDPLPSLIQLSKGTRFFQIEGLHISRHSSPSLSTCWLIEVFNSLLIRARALPERGIVAGSAERCSNFLAISASAFGMDPGKGSKLSSKKRLQVVQQKAAASLGCCDADSQPCRSPAWLIWGSFSRPSSSTTGMLVAF